MNTSDLQYFLTNSSTVIENDVVIEMGAKLAYEVLLGIICLLGLLSNIFVIWILLSFSKRRTTTGTYIVNLAVVDVCSLIVIPFTIATTIKSFWMFGEVLCKTYFVVGNVAQSAGALLLILLSADCYIAVCHPRLQEKFRSPFILKCVIITTWLFCIILSVPIAIFAKQIENIVLDETGQDKLVKICVMVWSKNDEINWENNQKIAARIILCNCVFYFLIPLCLTFLFTGLVIQKQKSFKKTTTLITAAGTVYFLCWFPFWTMQLWVIFENNKYSPQFIEKMYMFTMCWSYYKCVINPIMYLVFSHSFRNSLLKTKKNVNNMVDCESSVFFENIPTSSKSTELQSINNEEKL